MAKIIVKTTPTVARITASKYGVRGLPGADGPPTEETFESISQNLLGQDYTINRTNGDVTSIVYSLAAGGSITKTLYRTDGAVSSITLSGSTPSGINVTKTLIRSGGNITGVVYS